LIAICRDQFARPVRSGQGFEGSIRQKAYLWRADAVSADGIRVVVALRKAIPVIEPHQLRGFAGRPDVIASVTFLPSMATYGEHLLRADISIPTAIALDFCCEVQ
jgi:hypothetical protein